MHNNDIIKKIKYMNNMNPLLFKYDDVNNFN